MRASAPTQPWTLRSKYPFGGSAKAPFVVERELELRKGRKTSVVCVRFRAPVPTRLGYWCGLQIDGLLDRPPGRTGILGTDSLDALHNAMQVATCYLLASDAYQQGRLTWLGQFDLHLPVKDEIVPLIRKDLEAARLAEWFTFGRAARAPARPSTRAPDPPPARAASPALAPPRRRG